MKQSLHLGLGQQLKMTPQLQQAVRLLQMGTLEVQAEIQTALNNNPLLEIDESESQQRSVDETLTENTLKSNDETAQNNDIKDGNDSLEQLPYAEDWSSKKPYSENEHTLDAWDLLSNQVPPSLTEHLSQQLKLNHLSDSDQWITAVLMDALDEQGFLSESIESILSTCQSRFEDIEEDEVLANLHRIQHLDPIGIGALNLQDFLLIQLNQYNAEHPEHLILAKTLVQEHLDLLGKRDYLKLKRILKLSEQTLAHALTLIQSLRPRPASHLHHANTQHITPDVYVFQRANQWVVESNPNITPPLSINALYASMAKQSQSKADKEYIQNHTQEAKWLIKSLENRNDTILKTARAIVAQQRAFFDYGEAGMKALILKDIAQITELHESTISRVTTGKYMHTPRGIFEFKHFFSSHVSTTDGGSCSATAIRAQIKTLIDNEPPHKPLSDNKLCLLLKDDGIEIARRTVAKYREELGIPATNLRKQITS